MKVFVAGATGAVGRPLVRQLLAAGHEVTALTRSPERAERLRSQGVEAVVGDALDAVGVRDAVRRARPEVLVHQLTTFPATLRPLKARRQLVQTNRLRSEGTRILVDAAAEAGARRIVAQSIALLYVPGPGKRSEADPVYRDGAGMMGALARAVADLEDAVTGTPKLEGVALRYGGWYGPGTHLAPDGLLGRLARRRLLAVPKGAKGQWSALHVEDAASAVLAALEGETGVFNVVDDEPAPWDEILTAFAEAIGAPPPRRSPGFAARLGGAYLRHLLTALPPVSNERARRVLGWTPRYPTWREGIRTGLG